MAKKKKIFMFYLDPGHGWMRVPRTMLTELGIADQITRFSFAKGKYVYLEEDKDAATFIRAYRETNNGEIQFTEKYSYNDSSIRTYPSYTVEA